MENHEQNYDDIPMSEVTKTIQMLSSMPQDKTNIMQLATALGVHMCKLQKEFGYPPIFPVDLIPLPKSLIKKWGFNYASLVVKKQGILKQFQQDAALYFTRFREITESQWDAIKSNSVENIVLYNAEVRDKRASSLPISLEFKTIIDTYRAEYDAEVNELHSFLKANKPKGCLSLFLLLLLLNITLVWLFLTN
jgi:hypothetical protein